MIDSRIPLYRLLAQAFAYPDPDFVSRMQVAVGEINLELLDSQEISFASFIRELGTLSALPLDQVQGEYTRLFISAYPHVPCPPYESAYREGVLLGDAAEEVSRYYRKWGLRVEGEEVDHVGAELEFLVFLLTLDDPDAKADADQFFEDHIVSWIPQIADDISRESRIGYYREVGSLLSAVSRHGSDFQAQSCPEGHNR